MYFPHRISWNDMISILRAIILHGYDPRLPEITDEQLTDAKEKEAHEYRDLIKHIRHDKKKCSHDDVYEPLKDWDTADTKDYDNNLGEYSFLNLLTSYQKYLFRNETSVGYIFMTMSNVLMMKQALFLVYIDKKLIPTLKNPLKILMKNLKEYPKLCCKFYIRSFLTNHISNFIGMCLNLPVLYYQCLTVPLISSFVNCGIHPLFHKQKISNSELAFNTCQSIILNGWSNIPILKKMVNIIKPIGKWFLKILKIIIGHKKIYSVITGTMITPHPVYVWPLFFKSAFFLTVAHLITPLLPLIYLYLGIRILTSVKKLISFLYCGSTKEKPIKKKSTQRKSWSKINYTQRPSWSKINYTQRPSWSKTNYTQRPSWSKTNYTQRPSWSKKNYTQRASWSKTNYTQRASWSKKNYTQRASWSKTNYTQRASLSKC